MLSDLLRRYEEDPELDRLARRIEQELSSATEGALYALAFTILSHLIRASSREEEGYLGFSRERILDDP
jgi:hypothetical protein